MIDSLIWIAIVCGLGFVAFKYFIFNKNISTKIKIIVSIVTIILIATGLWAVLVAGSTYYSRNYF